MNEKEICQTHTDHGHSLMGELICHLPYAIFSVALGLIALSFLSFFGLNNGSIANKKGLHMLFHSFHFLHIIFATTGSLITFSRFSQNLLKGFVVALCSALFFCTLSDIILPYLAGRLLGVSMHLHLCLFSELHNIVPFLAVGLLNGLVMSKHSQAKKGIYSIGSHFAHILTSSLASLFYLVSEGFVNWSAQMGLVFLLLILAVLIPCTFADVIVPVLFAQPKKRDKKYQAGKLWARSRKSDEEYQVGEHQEII
jgi:hypothetical protein